MAVTANFNPRSALAQVQFLRCLALAGITREGRSRQLRPAIGRIGKELISG